MKICATFVRLSPDCSYRKRFPSRSTPIVTVPDDITSPTFMVFEP